MVYASSLLAQTPTYQRDIKPIITQHCATPCHYPGGVGPFSLLTYEDVAKRAKFIAKVTQIRYMPPFPADRTFQHYANERGLSDKEIELIQTWVKGVMSEERGTMSAERKVMSKSRQQTATAGSHRSSLIRAGVPVHHSHPPDLTLRMTTPYPIKGDGREDFRYFHIPTNLKEDVWIQAIEFVPGNRKLLHHSRLMVDTTGTMVGIDGMAEDDPRVNSFQKTRLADEFLYGWVPGNDRVTFPTGTAKRLRAGSDLIVNIHYAPSGKADSDQSEIRLYFAKTPVTKEVKTLTITENNISNQPFLIPANEKKLFFVQFGPFPDTVRLLSVMPHMHWLGKTVKAFAVTPDGEAVNLIKIDDWDYKWQMTYTFQQPLTLPKGTILIAEATYDNTAGNPLNPNRPPRDVSYGWNSTNEMMNLVFYFTQ